MPTPTADRAFVNTPGPTPAKPRKAAVGLAIRYGFAGCPLGRVVVAATDRGICCIAFGDDDAELTAGLKTRFPRADLRPAGPDFAATVARVVAYLADPARGLGLPLDVRGTAFQRRAWDEIQRIPPGGTATYTEVAVRIGSPAAVRAVAGACAANPVAVVVPCHRVVHTGGGLSGYRWGLRRKAELLRREAEASAGKSV